MSVDVKKIKVGDTVVYQNGSMCTVTYIKDWPVRHGQKEFTVVTYNETLEEHRTRTYNEFGHVVVDGEPDKNFMASQADEWDIVKHIPVESYAETSEETPIDATTIKVEDKVRTDDIVTILNFTDTELEDNIVSSLAGLQLTDRQIQGLNAMLTAFSEEAKHMWGWEIDVYIRND